MYVILMNSEHSLIVQLTVFEATYLDYFTSKAFYFTCSDVVIA